MLRTIRGDAYACYNHCQIAFGEFRQELSKGHRQNFTSEI